MCAITEKSVQFFVPCDPTLRYFYSVEIHPTEESMHRAIAKLRGHRPTRNDLSAKAVCLRFKLETDNKTLQRKHDQLGTIYFVQGQFTPEEAVHELVHAAIGWAKRVRIDPRKQSDDYTKCPEERFARTLQFMHLHFFQCLNRINNPIVT